jgi:hypothetical protein
VKAAGNSNLNIKKKKNNNNKEQLGAIGKNNTILEIGEPNSGGFLDVWGSGTC